MNSSTPPTTAPPADSTDRNSRGEAKNPLAAALEWAVAACIAVSLIWPLGMMAASSLLMAFGLWCFLSGRWKWQPTDKPSAIMNATFAAYAAGSAAVIWLHGEAPENYEQYLPFLGAGLFAVGLRVAAPRPSLIGSAFAGAAILAAAACIAQVATAGEMHRARFFLVSTTFGTMGALYAIICMAMMGWTAAAESGRQRAVLAAGAACGVIVALLSGSKGAWLPLAVIGPPAFLCATRKHSWRRKTAWLAVPAVIAGAMALLPNSPVIPRIKEALHEGDPCRLAYWHVSLKLFREQPWTGVPRDDLRRQLDSAALRVRNNVQFPEGPPREAHNEYLDALANRGLAGFALVLAALGVPLAVLARLRPGERGPATAGILFVLAFALSGLTDALFVINIKRMTFLFFVLFCAMAATPAKGAPGGD